MDSKGTQAVSFTWVYLCSGVVWALSVPITHIVNIVPNFNFFNGTDIKWTKFTFIFLKQQRRKQSQLNSHHSCKRKKFSNNNTKGRTKSKKIIWLFKLNKCRFMTKVFNFSFHHEWKKFIQSRHCWAAEYPGKAGTPFFVHVFVQSLCFSPLTLVFWMTNILEPYLIREMDDGELLFPMEAEFKFFSFRCMLPGCVAFWSIFSDSSSDLKTCMGACSLMFPSVQICSYSQI